MQSHTKKAIQSGIASAIGYGAVTTGINYYSGDKFELWKILFEIIFFGVIMTVYFNYSLKKKANNNS